MEQFAFKATNQQGQRFSGTLMAADREMAMRCLVEKELVVTHIGLVRTLSLVGRMRQWLGMGQRPEMQGEGLYSFSQQMAAMLDAGVPIKEAFEVLQGDAAEARVGRLFQDLSTRLGAGASVAEALAAHPQVFSRQYVATVAAGESSGNLPEALHVMAHVLERAERLRSQMRAALAYPVFVCLLALVFLAAMLLLVVPRYTAFYQGLGGDLPVATAALLGAGQLVQQHALALAGAGVLLVLLGRQGLRTQAGRLWLDGTLLRLPGLGALFSLLAVARLCRSLAALLKGGVSLMHALGLVGETMGNRVLERSVSRLGPQVLEGATLVEALRATGIMPDMALAMVAAGERSGRLDAMLERVAAYYEERVETGFKAWASLVEPMVILLVGLVVGAMIVVLVMPVFGLVNVLMK